MTHPIYAEFAKEAAEEPSIDLLKEPEVQAFRIPAEDLEPYLEEVNRAQESVLVVSRSSQEDRIWARSKRLSASCSAALGPSGCGAASRIPGCTSRRTGRRQQAGWAAAAAAKIRDGADLKKVAFFRSMVQTQLGAMMVRAAEQKREEPRLIMTPAEAIRAQEEARARGQRRYNSTYL